MTRKRFVKLLMADGYSRNAANTAAMIARSRGIEYGTAYKANEIGLKLDAAGVDALCNAVKNIVDIATKVAWAISKAVCAFAETYTKEMEKINHE